MLPLVSSWVNMNVNLLLDGGAGGADPWSGGSGAGASGGYPGSSYSAPPPTVPSAYTSNNIHLPHDNLVSRHIHSAVISASYNNDLKKVFRCVTLFSGTKHNKIKFTVGHCI